jgi:hypothetical protein
MPYLTMTPQTSVIRAYDQPGGYESRLPYQAIVTVTHLTDKLAYLHGAVGKVDRETWEKTLGLLREKGVETLTLERHGVIKTLDLRPKKTPEPLAQ